MFLPNPSVYPLLMERQTQAEFREHSTQERRGCGMLAVWAGDLDVRERQW